VAINSRLLKREERIMVQLNQFAGIAITFVVLAIVIGIGGTVLDEIDDTQTTNGIAYNATQDGLAGIETFGEWLPTIAVILASALVIGIIASYFYMRS
jgi:hypothetical protein